MSARNQPQLNVYPGEPQHEVFPRIVEMFPTGRMQPEAPRPFVRGPALALPPEFSFDGRTRHLADFLASTDTVALLVAKQGRFVLEEYFLTGGRTVNWISWSVAKSFVSAIVGIVIVKLSANRRYGTSPGESTNREMETIEFLRAVAAATD